MKFRILVLCLLLSAKFLACKCNGDPTLKSSFERADFVFIGEIDQITEMPSGFKTAQNILSRVKINKIYKSDYDDGFYQQAATLFGSPLNSCDVLFSEKGKYLIFAYHDQRTGFLYSDHCLVQKKEDQLSPAEFKELESLSNAHKKQTENMSTDNEIVTDLITNDSASEGQIKDLRKEISGLSIQNNRYKIMIYSSVFVMVMLLAALIVLQKKNKK
ncbi:hypothetical protein [Chryseobacterium pennipullorum]|uniref:Tissue inhibitor of metalloproteinase n=1 Tax=Chryseobacterium pennipullorum TaxID=2258963 RepID=A0A3D9AQU4_9FLAO|nr:hypothetical protein [Chryseobacterium pennipullorum]REC43367.1 hypothetical protein DRF67_19395 [Chryseobacterium pennipullorum]